MKFKPTPPRARIYAFQKILRICVSCILFVIGIWHGYQAYIVFFAKTAKSTADGWTSVFLSIVFLGCSLYLYQERDNNTPRYDGFEP